MGLTEVEELRARCSELEALYREAVQAKDEAVEERNKATVVIAFQLEKETAELNSRIERLEGEKERLLIDNEDLTVRLEFSRNDLKSLQQKHIKLQLECEEHIVERDAVLEKVKQLEVKTCELAQEIEVLLENQSKVEPISENSTELVKDLPVCDESDNRERIGEEQVSDSNKDSNKECGARCDNICDNNVKIVITNCSNIYNDDKVDGNNSTTTTNNNTISGSSDDRISNNGSDLALNNTGDCITTDREEHNPGVKDPEKTPTSLVNGHTSTMKEEAEEENLELEPRPPIELKKSPLEADYDVHEDLGKGRFGVVKRVTDKASGTVYAAKYIKTSGVLSGSSRDDVLREIDLMSKLHHKRLVGLLDAYDAGKNIIMIMEFISGGELFERVADEDCLTEKEAAYYMHQLLQGLDHMHKKHIIHLDLKPENIVCVSKDNWDIKLIDFGLAQEYEDGQKVKALKGTPEFMAPEAANYEPISKATDMWSAGVIAYILLSGLSPFMGDDNNETLSNVTAVEWDFDDESFDVITEEAKDFISALLVKNPKKRNTVEDCLKHEWMKKSASTSAVKINTSKLKQFLAKRRWQKQYTNPANESELTLDDGEGEDCNEEKSVNALKAVRRLSSMGNLLGLAKARKSIAPSLETVNAHSGDEQEENAEGREHVQNGEAEASIIEEKGSEEQEVKEKEAPKEPAFAKELDDVTVNEGEQIAFEVTVTGDPGCKVEWFKNGGDVEESDRLTLVNHGDGRHSLKISACDDDAMGEYCCVASNESGRVTTASYLTVEVEGASQEEEHIEEEEEEELEDSEPEGDPPVFETEFTDITVKEGETVTLSVVVRGEDYELEWFKNAVDVVEGGRFSFTSEGDGKHALVITDVEDDDTGEYCCVAQNDAGRTTCAGNLRVDVDEEEEEESEDETDEEFYEEKVVRLKKEDIEDSYVLEEEIGRGRFGIVRKCVHMGTAVHFVAKSVKTRPSQKEDFTREIDVMNNLHHPNLCRIRDAFDKPREIIIVMEFNRGGDLLGRITNTPMSEPEAVEILQQILDGVSFMHEHGYMHLDLKPENVMFKREGGTRIKLIDFSLARKYDPTSDTKISHGTAEYVAPEVVAYEPVSLATDMWSVGVTTYMTLGGSSPFLGESEADTFSNISQCRWSFTEVFDDVTEEAKDFISKLLVRSPSERMTVSQCLEHSWITTAGRQGRRHRSSTITRPCLSDINSNILASEDLSESISSVESFLRTNSVDTEDGGKSSAGNKELESTIQTLLVKLKEVESERAELEEKVKVEEEKAETLEEDLEEMEKGHKSLDGKLKKLEKENEKLNREVKSKMDLLMRVGSLETQRKGLEEELNKKNTQFSKMQDKYNALKGKLEHYDALEDKVYQYEREKKNFERENKRLKERIEELRNDENEREEKKLGHEKERDAQICALTKERDDFEKRYESLRQEKDSLVAELTKKFQVMEEQKAVVVEECKVLEDKVRDLEKRLRKSSQDFKKVTGELKFANEEIEEMKKMSSKELERQVVELKKEKSDLEKEANKFRKQREDTQKTCEELASKLSKSYSDLEKAKSQNKMDEETAKLRNELVEAQAKLEASHKKNRKMSKELKSRDVELGELQEKVDTLAVENERLFELQTTASETGSERDSESELSDEAQTKEREKLEKRIIDSQSTIIAHESTIAGLYNDISQLQDKLSHEVRKTRGLEEKIESQRQDIKRIKREKSEMIDKYEDELEEALDCYEESKKEMETRYAKRIRDLERARDVHEAEAKEYRRNHDSPTKSDHSTKSVPELEEVLTELKRLNDSRRVESDNEVINVLKKRIIRLDEMTNKDFAFVLQEKDEIVRNLTMNLDDLNTELEAKKNMVRSKEQENKDLALKVKELERFAKEKASKLFELQCKLDDMEREKKTGLDSFATLANKCQDLEQELRALQSLEKEHKKFQELYNLQQEELRDLEEEMESLKKDQAEIPRLRAVESEYKKLLELNNKQEKELKKKAQDNGLLQEENQYFSVETMKLKKDKLEEHRMYSNIEKSNVRLKEDLKLVCHELNNLKKEHSKSMDLYEQQEVELSSKNAKLEALKDEVEKLNGQLETGINKYLKLQTEVNYLREKAGFLEQENLELKTNFENLSFEFVNLQKKRKDSEEATRHIPRSPLMEISRNSISVMEEKCNDDFVGLRNDISPQKHELEGHENAYIGREFKSEDLNGLKQEPRNLEERHEGKRGTHSSIFTTTLEKKYKELELENRSLRESNNLKTTAVERAIADVTRLEKELRDCRKRLEETESEKNKIQMNLQIVQADLRQRMEELRTVKKNEIRSTGSTRERKRSLPSDLHDDRSLRQNPYQLHAVRHRILTSVQRPLEEANLPWEHYVSTDDVMHGRAASWGKIKKGITMLVEERDKLLAGKVSLQATLTDMKGEYEKALSWYEGLKEERSRIMENLKERKEEISSLEREQREADTITKRNDDAHSETRGKMNKFISDVSVTGEQTPENSSIRDTTNNDEHHRTFVQFILETITELENMIRASFLFDKILTELETKWEELDITVEISSHQSSADSSSDNDLSDRTREYYPIDESVLPNTDKHIPFHSDFLGSDWLVIDPAGFYGSPARLNGVLRELVHKNRRIHGLLQEIESLNKRLEEENQTKEGKVNSSENQSLRTEIKQLQREKEELNGFVKDSVAKVESYSTELETQKRHNKEMEEEIIGLNRFIKDSSIPALREQIKELEESEKMLKKEKEQLNLQIATREKKLAWYEEEIQKLQDLFSRGSNGGSTASGESGSISLSGTGGPDGGVGQLKGFDIVDELRKELKSAKERIATLEVEHEQLQATFQEKLKSEQDEMENKWAKRLRKECSELQADLAEKYNHDRRVWQKREIELQNMIRQMKVLMDKRAKDAENEKKRLERELANVSSNHDNPGSIDSNSLSEETDEGNTGETGTGQGLPSNDAMSDRELRRVAYKLTNDEWSELGTFLGVTETELSKLTNMNMGPQERAFKVMCHWRSHSKLGKTQLVSQLAVALEEINRKDVAQFVVEQMMPGKPRKKFFGWKYVKKTS